jgi:hypothetical protein
MYFFQKNHHAHNPHKRKFLILSGSDRKTESRASREFHYEKIALTDRLEQRWWLGCA